MASRFEAPSINQSYFERARERLSDCVIAHVRPHGRASDVTLRTPFEVGVRASAVSEQTSFLPSSGKTESPPLADKLIAEAVSTTYNDNRRSKLSRHVPVRSTAAFNTPQRVRNCRNQTIEEKVRAYENKKAIRREQCRTNQARYRNRQRIQEHRLVQSANELHEEVQELKLKHERLCYNQKTNRSPWAIISDVFQLLETSFRSPWRMTDDNEMKRHAGTKENLKGLQKSFTHGVAIGELSGVEALLEQLRRWSLYFGEPQLHLQRVEEVVPGVLTATARLRVTVSEFTLRCVFPHLSKTKDEDVEDEDELQSLREKLLNQRLTCSCTMTFLLDEETGRVERLETSVDWMGALCRLLGDVRAVEHVLDQALLSSEGVVGDLTDHPGYTRSVGASDVVYVAKTLMHLLNEQHTRSVVLRVSMQVTDFLQPADNSKLTRRSVGHELSIVHPPLAMATPFRPSQSCLLLFIIILEAAWAQSAIVRRNRRRNPRFNDPKELHEQCPAVYEASL